TRRRPRVHDREGVLLRRRAHEAAGRLRLVGTALRFRRTLPVRLGPAPLAGGAKSSGQHLARSAPRRGERRRNARCSAPHAPPRAGAFGAGLSYARRSAALQGFGASPVNSISSFPRNVASPRSEDAISLPVSRVTLAPGSAKIFCTTTRP